MIFQLTQVAINALAVTPSLRPTTYQLGNGTGYTPSLTDTGIHGTLVNSGTLSTADIVSGTVIRYGITLGYDLGPFTVGEVGLFTPDGKLFALAVLDTPFQKEPTSAGTYTTNSVRLDCYLSAVGTAYNMWLDAAETSNAFQMAVLNAVDSLPLGQGTVPSAYVVRESLGVTLRAYTDGFGLWSFSGYSASSAINVGSADLLSVTFPASAYSGPLDLSLNPIVEFVTTEFYSVCRLVTSIVQASGNITLGWSTPLTTAPLVTDQFLILEKDLLKPATSTILGGVKAGTGVNIASDGTISVPTTTSSLTREVVTVGSVGVSATTRIDLSSLAPATYGYQTVVFALVRIDTGATDVYSVQLIETVSGVDTVIYQSAVLTGPYKDTIPFSWDRQTTGSTLSLAVTATTTGTSNTSATLVSQGV